MVQFSGPRIDPVSKLCMRPLQEVLFTSIVSGLFAEGLMPNGSIFDVGANRGIWACYWASIAPDRVVHAMDPDPKYVKIMKAHYSHMRNLQPMLGALGKQSVLSSHRKAEAGGMHFFPLSIDAKGGSLQVYALDDLFDSWRDERLAFAQFDVDGFELSLLQGARAVLTRDRPIFSTELHVHENPQASRALLRFIKSLGYSSYLIEEIAGNRADIRNILNVPHERTAKLLGSPILDLAAQSRKLFAVDASTIHQFAFPCCVKGRACCPAERRYAECCAHYRVSEWMSDVLNHGGADLQWGTRATWYDQRLWVWGPQLAHVQHQEMTRNTSSQYYGLSYNKEPPANEYKDALNDFMARSDLTARSHTGPLTRSDRSGLITPEGNVKGTVRTWSAHPKVVFL